MTERKSILFPFWVGLGFYITIRLTVDSITKVKFWERPTATTAIELAGTIGLSYLIVQGISYLIHEFDKKQFDSPARQIRYELLRVWLFTALVFNIFANLLTALTDDGLNWHDLIINNILGSLITIVLYLYFRANKFLNSYVNEKLKSEKLQREKVETELQFLKAQINPHFLFNALNGIYVQIEDDPQASLRTLERFSDMLRYQLYECSKDKVLLQKEIDFLKNYIALEQNRKTDRLKLELDLNARYDQTQIAPFILQPLVENAFKHLGEPPWIKIKAKMEDAFFEFTVQNSTSGGNQSASPIDASGIGLQNVKRRLVLLYPDKHEFHIEQNTEHFHSSVKIKLDEN